MMQITAQTSGTLAVGDPLPTYAPNPSECQTGCPTCTCHNFGCPYGENTGRFVMVAAVREPTFPFPKAKPEPRRPFHQRVNRKPWERR